MQTLAGGWATSFRLHVQPDRRSCVFGCDPSCCPDAFAHYLVCKRLWHLVALPRGCLHGCVLARLGIHDANCAGTATHDDAIQHVLVRLAICYRLYHAVKDGNHIIDTEVPFMNYHIHVNSVQAARYALRLGPNPHGGAPPSAPPAARG